MSTVPPRVIPVLQISDGFLVKTTKFAKPQYIGDPINAVKIFNEKDVDELVVVDIDAAARGSGPRYELLESIASEAFMPVGYGGGVRSAEDAGRILALGMEKVVLNSTAQTGDVMAAIAARVGSQSVVASLDVRRTLLGRPVAHVSGGRTSTGVDAVEWARRAVESGAGELLVTSIDRDGTGTGYDLPLISAVAAAVDVPVVSLGGAGELDDLRRALAAGASAVAAGSLFVYFGKHRAVLITYPTVEQIASLG